MTGYVDTVVNNATVDNSYLEYAFAHQEKQRQSLLTPDDKRKELIYKLLCSTSVYAISR